MKNAIIAALVLTVAFPATAAIDEQVCLSSGTLAASVAEIRTHGVSEEEVAKMIAKEVGLLQGARDIISYVFMMELQPKEARRQVYLKCMSTKFGTSRKPVK